MIGALVVGAAVGYLAGGEGKTRAVRLADVGLVGPLMIYVALAPLETPPGARWALAAVGAATIVYNARNL